MSNLGWTRIILPNGIIVLMFPRPSSMTAQLSVAVRYGSNFETEESAGMAHFLEHLIAGGSKKRIALSRSIEQMGGYADFSTANEDTMIITDIIPEKINKTSKTLLELVCDSEFEKEKVESERKIILHEIAEVEDNPWATLDELLRKSLFKNHPIKRPVLGFRKTVSKLSLSMLREAHQTQFIPQNMILLLTGKFSENDAKTICQNFANLNNAKLKPKQIIQIENGKQQKEAKKEKEGISQSYLSVGLKTANAKHEDTPALDVIDTILGAGASSRLFIELREKRAFAYSVESGHNYGSDYGYLHIDCAIENKHFDETQKLLFKEIAKLRNQRVSESELNKAKDIIAGSILRTLDSPIDFPETLVNMEIQFGTENALQNYLDRIKSLTVNDVADAANKYLTESNLSLAVVSPKH